LLFCAGAQSNTSAIIFSSKFHSSKSIYQTTPVLNPFQGAKRKVFEDLYIETDPQKLYEGLPHTSTELRDAANKVGQSFVPHDINSRFAKYVFLESMQFEGARQRVMNELQLLLDFTKMDPNVNTKILSQRTPESIRFAAIRTYIDSTQLNLHPVTKRTLGLMAYNKLLPALESIITTLNQLDSAFENKVDVEIIVASKADIDEKFINSVSDIAKKKLSKKAKPTFHIKEDSKLLAGYKIKIGFDTIQEHSLKSDINDAVKKRIEILDTTISLLNRFVKDRQTWDLDKSSIDASQWNWTFNALRTLISSKTGIKEVATAAGKDSGITSDVSTNESKRRAFAMYGFEKAKKK